MEDKEIFGDMWREGERGKENNTREIEKEQQHNKVVLFALL